MKHIQQKHCHLFSSNILVWSGETKFIVIYSANRSNMASLFQKYDLSVLTGMRQRRTGWLSGWTGCWTGCRLKLAGDGITNSLWFSGWRRIWLNCAPTVPRGLISPGESIIAGLLYFIIARPKQGFGRTARILNRQFLLESSPFSVKIVNLNVHFAFFF